MVVTPPIIPMLRQVSRLPSCHVAIHSLHAEERSAKASLSMSEQVALLTRSTNRSSYSESPPVVYFWRVQLDSFIANHLANKGHGDRVEEVYCVSKKQTDEATAYQYYLTEAVRTK